MRQSVFMMMALAESLSHQPMQTNTIKRHKVGSGINRKKIKAKRKQKRK